jgi:hypothetical protein
MTRLAQVEKAILAAAPATPTGPAARSARWDHAAAPARLDRVTARLGLGAAELEVLHREGFVVPERLGYDGYTLALHEIYQSELPIYVSVDPILHAVFVSHDGLVERLERTRVLPVLQRVIDGMRRALPKAAPEYAPEVAADVGVYLGVAAALLAGTKGGPDAQTADLVARATRGGGLEKVNLFGRERMIDFSQYTPRGHYAKSQLLGRFFRAAMWLSRLELNLVSRSSRSSEPGVTPNPEETPREATVALALADLAGRAGVLGQIDELDRAWGALAGAREDVPFAELARIQGAAGTALTPAQAYPALKIALGDRYRRTTRLHYMPEGSTELPAIATMLGPRIVPDAAATRPLVHGDLPGRDDLGAADLAFALGHDRAKRYLTADLAAFPGLDAALDKARSLALAPPPAGSKDVYGAWLGAVKGLAEAPRGEVPSFMTGDGFRDLRVSSAIAAYGQLKHAYVLIAGEPYSEGACEVPDGYVDPALGVWDGLIAYAERSAEAFRAIDPRDAAGAQGYFARLGGVVRVLRAIAVEELAGRPLSPEALAFLSMVVEIHAQDIGTGYTTSYNGWYFDLFLTRPGETTEAPPGRADEPSMKYAGFIASYFTSAASGNVAYVGAKGPRLGVFVVDTGGPPRVVVGPVASAFEHHGPLEKRLDDAQVRKLEGTRAPWAASYTVKAPAEPPLAVAIAALGPYEDATHRARVQVRSNRELGPVTVTLLDHHRVEVATQTREVGTASTMFVFPARPKQRIPRGTHANEMVQIRVGDFEVFVDLVATTGWRERGFGGMRAPAPLPWE